MTNQLSPALILGILAAYFFMLLLISYFTGKDSSNDSFFLAKHKSPWYLVAFGMIGASISGVSFISVPGEVYYNKFAYFQLVLGYLVGYFTIAMVLMPLYYRLQLTSIYTYFEGRFGKVSYKTGSAFFLLSRSVGSALRLYLMAIVLQTFVMEAFGVPFWLTVLVTIFLIWTYTFKGGIRTIVFTDTFQTFFLLTALVMTVVLVIKNIDLTFGQLIDSLFESGLTKTFYFDDPVSDKLYFWKQFLGGAAIAVTMSGMDQDIMQKNLTCKNIGEAKKNMFWFSTLLVVVNLLFLLLGALLYIYVAEADSVDLPVRIVNGDVRIATDLVYPTIALKYLPPIVGIFFILGIIASTYASSDSALAALTTAFCIDFLNFDKRAEKGEDTVRIRHMVHIGFSLLLFLIVLLFWFWNDQTVIYLVLRLAGFTYGPLLGLFAFGLLTKRPVRDKLVPVICLLSPVLTYLIDLNSKTLFNGYVFSYELLLVNGLITFAGLALLSVGSVGKTMVND